jgi:hypothetical protein
MDHLCDLSVKSSARITVPIHAAGASSRDGYSVHRGRCSTCQGTGTLTCIYPGTSAVRTIVLSTRDRSPRIQCPEKIQLLVRRDLSQRETETGFSGTKDTHRVGYRTLTGSAL